MSSEQHVEDEWRVPSVESQQLADGSKANSQLMAAYCSQHNSTTPLLHYYSATAVLVRSTRPSD